MDKKANAGLWTIGIIQAAILILCLVAIANSGAQLSESEVKKIVSDEVAKIDFSMPDVVVPTAQEIADLVVVPKADELDNNKVDDLWKDLYGEEIDEIEANAEEDALAELEDDDYEVLEDYLIENLILPVDELEDVDVEDVDVEVINLGLEEDEDKVAQVVFEIEVEYSLEQGEVTNYKKDLVVVYDVVYDEGDFDDEDVELVSIT